MDRYRDVNVLIEDRSTPRVASGSAFQVDYATWHAHLSGSTGPVRPVDPLRFPMDHLELLPRRAR